MPATPSTPQTIEPQWCTEKAALDCYLPFKLFRSSSTQPHYRPSPVRQDHSKSSLDWREVGQMNEFVSETAQAMVGFHAQKCLPVKASGGNADIYKMETLSDLMKKHKDAFHREYEEFGPAGDWTPDVGGSSSKPISSAAMELGKRFDLRGELATISHVRRAQCRMK